MFQLTFTINYNRSDWVEMSEVIKRVASLVDNIDDLFIRDIVIDFREGEHD